MSNKLSVIIPFVNEFPQVLFTIQSIAQELIHRVDFEIIAVDNMCKELTDQFQKRVDQVKEKDPQAAKELENNLRKGTDSVKACSKYNPWLTYLNYDKKLSHWQAKNLGVKHSTGNILWFCDSHCVISRDSLYSMFLSYCDYYDDYHGSLHLPLTYKILESRRLIYKLVFNWDTAEIHYSFTGYRESDTPYEVPCMSTCGMMLGREIYNDIGGWPSELGIYGGGENYINFTLAVTGYKKHIFPGGPLFHHGDSRGYHWYYDDHVRNKMIAMYCYGGKDLVRKFSRNTKGRPETLSKMCEEVIEKCGKHRDIIKKKQVIGIYDWYVNNWR